MLPLYLCGCLGGGERGERFESYWGPMLLAMGSDRRQSQYLEKSSQPAFEDTVHPSWSMSSMLKVLRYCSKELEDVLERRKELDELEHGSLR